MMKLAEKIYQCRKKAGLSQEALATQLGVSRQAVSKWELGDAEPEPAKLKLLAEVFHVSVDWLLSEDDGEYTAPPQTSAPVPASGNLLRRYGWLAGLLVVLVGLGGVVSGTLARVMARQAVLGPIENTPPGAMVDESVNQAIIHRFYDSNPVYLMGGTIRMIGLVVLVAGIVLTILLYRRSRRK